MRTRARYRWLVVSILALAGGCSTRLTSAPINDTLTVAPPGIVYYLPQGDLQVGITREITKCDCFYVDPSDKAKKLACDIKKPRADWQFDVEVALTPTLETKYAANPANAYYIDYQDLSRWMKQTVINVNLYDNGTLRGINSELTDKTRQVLRDTLKGAINIAKMAMGVPSVSLEKAAVEPEREREVPPPAHICTAEVLAALANKTQIEVDVAARTKTIGDLEFDLAYDVQQGKKTDEELDKMRNKIADERKKVTKLNDRLDKERAKLTEVTLDSVVPSVGSLDFRLAPPPRITDGWFDRSATTFWAAHSNKGDFIDVDGLWVPAVMVAYAQVNMRTDVAKNAALKISTDGTVASGILYRQPAPAEVILCKERMCVTRTSDSIGIDRAYFMSTMGTLLPQLGPLARLPLENGALQTNTLIVEFSEMGTLTKLQYTDQSRAEQAAGAFLESTEAVSGLMKARGEADVSKIEADTKKIKAETDRLKAEKDKADAQKALKGALGGGATQ